MTTILSNQTLHSSTKPHSLSAKLQNRRDAELTTSSRIWEEFIVTNTDVGDVTDGICVGADSSGQARSLQTTFREALKADRKVLDSARADAVSTQRVDVSTYVTSDTGVTQMYSRYTANILTMEISVNACAEALLAGCVVIQAPVAGQTRCVDGTAWITLIRQLVKVRVAQTQSIGAYRVRVCALDVTVA